MRFRQVRTETQGVTVAVKKATAKKSAAKKPAAVKKATAKKPATKKSAAVKKAPVKKALVKKSAPKKAVAKKPVAKKTAIKKRAAKKKAIKRGAKPVEKFIVPPVPVPSISRTPRVEVSTIPAPVRIPVPAPTPTKKEGASGRVVFAVVVGIIILGLIVWSKSNGSNSGDIAKPLPTATATESAIPTPTPTPTESVVATITAHEAPQGVVAQYTATGATIFWKAPTAVDGLTGYNIEISLSNGPWKLISTVPATQMSLDVTKGDTTGWTSFRVSSVYSDSQTASAKAFGLPGSYS